MTAAKTVKGKSLLIKVSDMDEDTPVFAADCLVNSDRGIVFTAETNETKVPDCDDPELIAWINREKVSLSASINGAGTLHTPNVADYSTWFASEATKDIHVELQGIVLANGGGYWAGAFHLTSFEVTGSLGELVQCSLTLLSSGAVTWHVAAA